MVMFQYVTEFMHDYIINYPMRGNDDSPVEEDLSCT
jgi:hypothetical protein